MTPRSFYSKGGMIPGVMFGSARAKQDQRRPGLLAEERRVHEFRLSYFLDWDLALQTSSSGDKWFNFCQTSSTIDDL